MAPLYSPSAIQRLAERTVFEAWFLEAAYKIAEEELFPTFPDAIIYAANAAAPTYITYGRGNISIGDWRDGFLKAGAPLVFVTAFKLLDMIMEWVLEENGVAHSFRFQQKLNQLNNSICFPSTIESKPWLRERLISMYCTLKPLRGTIIHSKYFASYGGTIRVSSSQGNIIGPAVEIDPTALRRLALTLVSVLRYIDCTWSIDEHREKQLRHEFDHLRHLHGCAVLGQKRPFSPTVRVYSSEDNLRNIDIEKIKADIATHYVNEDCMFDLRIIIVEAGTATDAYLLQWEILQGGFNLVGKGDLEPHRVSIPDDIDMTHI